MKPAQKPERPRPTYGAIENLPPHLRGEIINGELVAQPRPAGAHVAVASQLGGLLSVGFNMGIGGPGGWWILHEPELSLGVDADYDPVVPDLAGWRFSTMPRVSTAPQFHVVPDWVCEILSPGTAASDRLLKLPFYGRARVKHCWLVDPIGRSIEVFRNTREGWLLVSTHQGAEELVAEPFGAMTIPLARVWFRGAEPE